MAKTKSQSYKESTSSKKRKQPDEGTPSRKAPETSTLNNLKCDMNMLTMMRGCSTSMLRLDIMWVSRGGSILRVLSLEKYIFYVLFWLVLVLGG